MGARILLIDDDRLLREVIGEYLVRKGFRVDMAENAAQALQKFKPGSYDLALIDLVLPGMSGLDLMRKLLDEDPKIFCLIMTGYPTIDSAYKAMVEGASDYIIKPFQLTELLSAIRQYLEP